MFESRQHIPLTLPKGNSSSRKAFIDFQAGIVKIQTSNTLYSWRVGRLTLSEAHPKA
jgi:hypothetical protein